jgi:2-furoyl-CoA dehydrogenase large subunit
MDLFGEAILDGAQDQIWSQLFNPETLRLLIPGCRELHRLAPDEYYGVIRLGLPAVAGQYDVKVQVISQAPPDNCRLGGLVTGPTGTISGSARLSLESRDNTCNLTYDAVAMISGPLSNISPRILEQAARELINQGIKKFNQELRSAEESY